MNTINVCNGVDIHISEVTKFKTNLMSVYFNIPLKRDTVTYAALLPSVLKRGCKKMPTMRDLSRKLDDLYSASLSMGVRTKGDGEVLYFSSEYIADEYIGENLTEEISKFLYNFIFEPIVENNGFKSEYLDTEKVNLKNTIEGLINDKKEYAEFKCRETMFNKQGFGMCEIGYVEDLPQISPQNLLEFYNKILNTAKVDIFLSGSINSESLEIVKENLASHFSPRNAEYIQTEIAEMSDKETQNITETADVVQSKLCMGLRCGVEPASKDYYSLMLANCVFGGSPFSKLFNNVREKLSLAYYASAHLVKFKSVMMISSGIQTENYQAAYDEIMLQFNKMKKGEISEGEITAAKKCISNSLRSVNDSLRGMEDFNLSQIINGTDETIEDIINNIMLVDKNQVADVMGKVKLDTVFFLKGKLKKEAE